MLITLKLSFKMLITLIFSRNDYYNTYNLEQ